MYTQLRASNFKNLAGDHSIDLRRITVFIGPNGAGKSSVLQALLLWRQSIGQNQIKTDGPFLDLGEPGDVQLTDRSPAKIGLTVEKSLPLPLLSGNGGEAGVVAAADAPVASGENQVSSTISVGSLELTRAWTESGAKVEPEIYRLGSLSLALRTGSDMTIPVLAVGGDQGLMKEGVQVTTLLNNSLSETRFVPALRGFEASRYSLQNEATTDFTQTTDPRQNANLLATSLALNDGLREDVGALLKSITGVTLEQRLMSQRRIAPVTTRGQAGGPRARVLPTNEGFGTNQLIHLLSQSLVTPIGGTVLIEEPESHLHPSAQSKLGMWVADHAVESGKQFLIATHSERVLAALLWQVRREVLTPADLIVHYFTLDEDGHSVHRRLNVTHGGLIQGSFREFFPPPEDTPEWNEFFRGLQG